MNKLSITLPLGAQVTIESDDRELVREVLHSFMPQLLGSNGAAPAATSSASPEPPAYSNGHSQDNGVSHHTPVEPVPVPAYVEPFLSAPANGGQPVVIQQAISPPIATEHPETVNGSSNGTFPLANATPGQLEFMAFCQRVNPLGDMRKVVVAAEAAHRYLDVASVDTDELFRLFALAGWPMPHSFVQTLRNAARTKFRWLERIQGRPGHYKVTGTGRSIVLGENNPSAETTPAKPDHYPQD
jgi:hypothetical protein